MWQKVAKFKGAEYFRKALYMIDFRVLFSSIYTQVQASLPEPKGGQLQKISPGDRIVMKCLIRKHWH